MSKINKIKDFITRNGSITKEEAARLFFEYGLGERIARLKNKGLNIETVMIHRCDKKAYAKYVLRND